VEEMRLGEPQLSRDTGYLRKLWIMYIIGLDSK